MKIKLYVAGYTDTVGDKKHNYELSNRRAKAIAGYFRKKGFKFPIMFQGFGEDALKEQTPDETDNQANRRAMYVLAGDMAPSGGSFPRQSWENLH